MKTWQYEITNALDQDALNQKGSEGWEVAAAYTEAPGLVPRLIWKREKLQERTGGSESG